MRNVWDSISVSSYPLEEFSAVESEWRSLNQRATGGSILLDEALVRLLIESFGPKNSRRQAQVVLIRSGAEAVAAMVVQLVVPGFWTLFCPPQAPAALCLIDSLWAENHLARHSHDPCAAGRALIRLLRPALSGLLILRLPHQDPSLSPLRKYFVPQAPRPACYEVRDWSITVSIDLHDGFEAYWSTRSSSLKQGVKRRIRNITHQHAPPKIATCVDFDSISLGVDIHAGFEMNSWKGDSGTAIVPGTAQHSFYRRLLQAFCRTGESKILQLWIGDKVVASQFALVRGKTCYLLKTSYDAEFRNFGPGRMLDFLAFRELSQSYGVNKFEYCTQATADDLRWSTSQRSISHVVVSALPIILVAYRLARRFRRKFDLPEIENHLYAS